MNEPQAPNKWPTLLRGSLLTSVMSKNIRYVHIVDARARTLITICALLIPILLTGLSTGTFIIGSSISLATCILSLGTSIFVLMPKKVIPSNNQNYSPLHFTSYSHVDEETYVQDMLELLQDQGKHTEYYIRDLYHLGRDVLKPKNQWQRFSYIAFLIGNGIAATIAIIESLALTK